jgi:hypothetical protein
VLPWWPKEATINLASEETLTLAGSSRYRWRNHLVMGGGIISLQVAASVGISIKDKQASGATVEDAEELARYERLAPKTNAFMDYVANATA